MSAPVTATDPVIKAVRQAMRSLQRAHKACYDDLRFADTACAGYVEMAIHSIEDAAKWATELVAEERRDERVKPPKPVEAEELACHVCDQDIVPGEETKCSGCDEITCPGCMGEDEVCNECEEEE